MELGTALQFGGVFYGGGVSYIEVEELEGANGEYIKSRI